MKRCMRRYSVSFIIALIAMTFMLEKPFAYAAKKPSPMNIKSLVSLRIPERFGTLDEVWVPNEKFGIQVPTGTEQGKESLKVQGLRVQGGEAGSQKSEDGKVKIVLHIRDAHCIYEAQMNIAQIIQHLARRYKIKWVCIEGSSGKVDTSVVNQFTSPLVKQDVLQDLMRKGKLSGPEYAAEVLNIPISLFGIENPDLYQKNLKAYQAVAPFREKSSQVFTLLDHQLQDLEPKVFSKGLKDLGDLIHRYDTSEILLNVYVAELLKIYEKQVSSVQAKDFQEQYSNVTLFMEKEGMEKGIDFQKVEGERTQFLTDVSARLEGDKLNQLVMKSLEFRLGQLSSLEYYTYFEGIKDEVFSADKAQFDATYPNLSKFILYEKVFGRIRVKNLFSEVDQIRDLISEKLAQTPEEKLLLNYSKTIKVFKRLYRSELNQKELGVFSSDKEQYQLAGIIQFLKESSEKHQIPLRDGFQFINETQLNGLAPSAQDFYTYAEKRNEALTGHIADLMEKEKASVVILVAGGFHTEAFKKFFKEKGMAYAVITPDIKGEVASNPYVSVMTDQGKNLDDLLLKIKVKPTQERGGLSQ